MPTVVLTIDGGVIDQATDDVTLGTLRPHVRGGIPTLSLAKRGTTLTAGVDPWDAKTVLLAIDGTTYFSGDTGMHVDRWDDALGMVREWTCYGLAKRAEYIPVTDENTFTDCIRYNVDGDSPDRIPARQGRSVGQIVADVLEMPTNRAALIAAGIGAYSSPTGGGASATCVLSGDGVGTVTIQNGGTNYASPPTVLFAGGGGTGATGTATLSGSAVDAVTVTDPGSGYTSPPVVILSTLPASTLADLDGLFVIPQAETDIVGERILQAVEDAVQASHPNHSLHVEPDTGAIRFLDPRTYTPMTLTMGTDPVERPKVVVDWSGCYQRCVVRGDGLVQAFTLGVRPLDGSALPDNGLEEQFEHDGLTNAEAKTAYRISDFNAPGQSPGRATATAAIGSGAVTTITVAFQGYSYTAAPAVSISGGGGTGATATATLTGDKVTSIAVTTGGTGYTTVPTVTVAPPGVGQNDIGTCTCPSTTQVTVTSADPLVSWTANYWDQSPTGRHAQIEVASDIITGVEQKFSARVIANTSMSPGGTSTFTLDRALPSTDYDHYTVFGEAGGASFVYRRYHVTIPEIAAAMANYFPYAVAFKNSDGTAATLTSTPKGTVFLSIAGDGDPPYQQLGIGITVDPVAGTITTEKPTVLAFAPNLTTLVPVDDFQAFIAVNTGALTIAWPADVAGVPQFEGTSHTELNLERTKFITIRDWRDLSNFANMQALAREYLDACSPIVYEGEMTYRGLLASVLKPGKSLSIAGNDGAGAYDTGMEAMESPIVSVELEFTEGPDSPVHFDTHLSFSTRRTPYSAAVFTRPGQRGQPFGLDVGLFTISPYAARESMRESMGGEGFDREGRNGQVADRGTGGEFEPFAQGDPFDLPMDEPTAGRPRSRRSRADGEEPPKTKAISSANPAAVARREAQEAKQQEMIAEQTRKDEARRAAADEAIQRQTATDAARQEMAAPAQEAAIKEQEDRQHAQEQFQQAKIAEQTQADQTRQAKQEQVQQAAVEEQNARQAKQEQAQQQAISEQDRLQAQREAERDKLMGGGG